MSYAPSETGSNTTSNMNLQGQTAAAATQTASPATTGTTVSSAGEGQPAGGQAATDEASPRRPTNLPLDAFDLMLSFVDGTPISENRIPVDKETPILFTVKIRNKPDGIEKMRMTVTISERGNNGWMGGASGRFSKNVKSTTYEQTVPIVSGADHHTLAIEIGHAAAESGGFHGGDGPYDVHMSFTPVLDGVEATGHGEDDEVDVDADEHAGSQIEETLSYSFIGFRTSTPISDGPVE